MSEFVCRVAKQLTHFPTQTLVLRLEKEKEDAVTVTNELKRENADLQQVLRGGGARAAGLSSWAGSPGPLLNTCLCRA